MSFLGDLYRNQTHLDFRPLWRRSLALSVALGVLTLGLLVFRGIDRSIEFEGGGIWQVQVPAGVTVADGREAAGLDNARVQLVEDPDGGNFIRVQSDIAGIETSESVVEGLAELGGVTADEVSISTVGPTWGSQITNKAIRALIAFFVVASAYLAWRLEWRMAFGAFVAVVHDLVITAGLYSLFGFTVSPPTVIALLTILGYSLYDTVVVYDKVLETERGPLGDHLSPSDLVNRSMNQVLMRSFNTTVTTVLPVASMLVIGGFFLGGESLWDFALALFIGLLLGTYSSIFVAAPVLVWLKERYPSGGVAQPDTPSSRRPVPSVGGFDGGDDVDDDVDGGGPGRPSRDSTVDVLAEPVIEARPRKKKRR